jgi:branched-subunit amino acid ABC-type transport system permease component
MSEAIQVLIGGLIVGSVYALIALGMSVIFSISRVINLAQGGFVVLAALTAVSIQQAFQPPPILLLIVTCALFAFVLAAVDLLIILPGSRRAGPDRLLLITVGLLQALGGLLLVVWGNLPYSMRPFSSPNSLTLLSVRIETQYFWVVGVLALCTVGLWFLLQRTSIGLTMRATAQDPRAAALMGVNVDKIRMVAFSMAGVMAAAAGVTLAPLTFLQYGTVVPYAVNGFIAAVVGGLGSSTGAVAGGLLLGLLQGIFTRYTDAATSQVLVIALLIGLLIVRPQGIRGRLAEVRR